MLKRESDLVHIFSGASSDCGASSLENSVGGPCESPGSVTVLADSGQG